MNLFFRKMNFRDLDVVKTIDKLCFSNPWPENAYLYELENNPNARSWVIETRNEQSNKIIGFAVIWIVLDEAHIGTIAIDPSFQAKGIGQYFLANVCLKLISENISKIFLEVRKSNSKAIKLYEKFSFNIDGERKNYYRDNGESAILMSAPIKNEVFYINMMKMVFENDLFRREIFT
ncbi:MAG TPA: ribosomal protein S18-alanine N-acetyltransferase [Anaerolineaceae bacterium]|nr:ribosomal protein S18-alanine N-acetyltransferase [Anaerolineaceae bacterium]